MSICTSDNWSFFMRILNKTRLIMQQVNSLDSSSLYQWTIKKVFGMNALPIEADRMLTIKKSGNKILFVLLRYDILEIVVCTTEPRLAEYIIAKFLSKTYDKQDIYCEISFNSKGHPIVALVKVRNKVRHHFLIYRA